MEPFSDQKFQKRLADLKDTQESIQSLSAWCLQYKSHSVNIVKYWLKAVKKSKVPQRLTLFYLANDVLQHSRRKQIYGFLSNWLTAFRDAVPLVRDEKVQKQILRMLSIWEERNVYKSEEVEELKALLAQPPPEEPEAHIDFETSLLFQKLQDFQKFEEETDLRQKKLNEAPLNITIDSESLRTLLKERGQSDTVLNELKDSIRRMEAVVDALSTEVGKRLALISLLKEAGSFYNHQRSEAKVVCSAYRSFGHKVKQFKEALDERIDTLPEPELPPLPKESSSSFESRLDNLNAMFGGAPPPPPPQAAFDIPSAAPLPFLPMLQHLTLPPNIMSVMMGGAAPPPPPPDTYATDESQSYDYSSQEVYPNKDQSGPDSAYNPYEVNLDFSEEMNELDFLDGDVDLRQKEKPTSRRENINTSNLISLTSRGDDSPQRLLKRLDLTALTNLRQKLKTALKKEVGGADLGAMDMDLSDDEVGEEAEDTTPSPLPPTPQENHGDFNYRQDVDFRSAQFGGSDRDMRPPDSDLRKPQVEMEFRPVPPPDVDFRTNTGGNPPDFGQYQHFGYPQQGSFPGTLGHTGGFNRPDMDFRRPPVSNNHHPPRQDSDFRPSVDPSFDHRPIFDTSNQPPSMDSWNTPGSDHHDSPNSGQSTMNSNFDQRPNFDARNNTEHTMQHPPVTDSWTRPGSDRHEPPNFGQPSMNSGFDQPPNFDPRTNPEHTANQPPGLNPWQTPAQLQHFGQQLSDLVKHLASEEKQERKEENRPSFEHEGDVNAWNPHEHQSPANAGNLQSMGGPATPKSNFQGGHGPRFGTPRGLLDRPIAPPPSDCSPGVTSTRPRFGNPRGSDKNRPGSRFGQPPSDFNSPRQDFGQPRPDFLSPRTANSDFRQRFTPRVGQHWRPNSENVEESGSQWPERGAPRPLMDFDFSENTELEPEHSFSSEGVQPEGHAEDFGSRPRPFFADLNLPQGGQEPHAFRSPHGFRPRFSPRFRGGPRF